MLIALFTLLFLGGDATPMLAYIDEYQERANTVITDASSREQAKSIFKTMEDRNKDHGKKVNGYGTQLGEMSEDPNATDAEIDAIWDQYFQDVDAYHAGLTDARFELKQYVSRDEWQAIFAPPVRLE